MSAGMLFDLDGTLLDTAPDMIGALNRLLSEHDRPGIEPASARHVVSHGAAALIQFGFGVAPGGEGFEPLRLRFLALYSEGLATHTRLFPGMERVLESLEGAGLAWGVVTNKPGWLTVPLLEALGLARRPACVVSGDTTAKRKPDPEPLFHACQAAGLDPRRSIYVGDAERDIEAGRRARMTTIAVRYGYVHPDEDLNAWGADALIDAPEQLLEWITPDRRGLRLA